MSISAGPGTYPPTVLSAGPLPGHLLMSLGPCTHSLKHAHPSPSSTCGASCLAHGPHTPRPPHSRREESRFWPHQQLLEHCPVRTEGAFGNRVSVLFFSSLFEESGGETGSHIGSSALCSKDGLNTLGACLLLPGAGITGLHCHTQFMQGWESNSDNSHAGQALCAALLRTAGN